MTEFKWIRNRPITIHLKTESEFGRKITFTPKSNGFRIFADNPLVAELKAAAQANGAGTNLIYETYDSLFHLVYWRAFAGFVFAFIH